MELEWPLILFTLFVCLSCGVLFAQGVLTVTGKGKKTQFISLVASAATLVIGGLAVFMHLQHWERIFNGFGHITSGITLELIGCVVFAIALVVYFLMMRRADDGVAPKWCGWMAIVVALGMTVVMGMSYLMPARPAWDTPLLIVFYLCNTVFMGGLASLIISGFAKADEAKDMGIKLALVGGGLQFLAVAGYATMIATSVDVYSNITYYFDPTLPDHPMIDIASVTGSIFTGNLALAFWLGTVAVGILAALALTLFAKKNATGKKLAAYAGAALVCVVVGGLCWRGILYAVAMSVFALY